MSALDKLMKSTKEQKDKEKTVSRVAVKTQGEVTKKGTSISESKSLLKEKSSLHNNTTKKVTISLPDDNIISSTDDNKQPTESKSPTPSTSPTPGQGIRKVPWVRHIGVLPDFDKRVFEETLKAIIEILLGKKRLGKPEEMTQQDIEGLIKISLDSKLVDEEGQTLKERLESDVRIESRITKDKTYYFKYLRPFKLDNKDDLMHVLNRYACISADHATDANNPKGLYISDLVGYYLGIEDDLVSLIANKTLAGIYVPISTKYKVPEPVGGESKEDTQVKEILRLILAGRHSASIIRIYLKLNFMDQLSNSILSGIDSWSSDVQQAWREPQLVSSATTIIQENNEAAKFPLFSRMESSSNSNKQKSSKKARNRRDYGGHLNAHMKVPDKMGLHYDFGKPFRVSEAEERLEILDEYKLKRAKQEADDQENDFNFNNENCEDSSEGSID